MTSKTRSEKALSLLPEEISLALTIRAVEYLLLDLFEQGKINGTVHTCIGQELNAVILLKYINSSDYIISNHRGHGHYIAKTRNTRGLIAELMGKTIGVSGGIGGSQHLFGHNFLGNGIQGGMTPIAAGIAFGQRLNESGSIVVCFIGDGTLGEGILYETLNICGIWDVPILFVLENNGIAQSTSQKQTFSGSVQDRVLGFGLRYFKSRTNDVDHLNNEANDAVTYVRTLSRPALIEISSARLKAHSKGDDNRSDDEIDVLNSDDLLNQILKEDDKYKCKFASIQTELATIVDDLLKEKCLNFYHSPSIIVNEEKKYIPFDATQDCRINELIYLSLRNELNNPHVLIIGEDIEHTTKYTPKPYGGAFKVTRDLSKLFAGRVLNTPISEGAIVGIGTGLSLVGFRPFVEVMFGDFLTLTFDQILQHSSKITEMYGIEIDIPLVVRTPMGGGRGYGPTHSQSLEKFFLGIPNLNIVAFNDRIPPSVIIDGIGQLHTPTLLIENKALYTRKLNEHRLNGFLIMQTEESFPTLCITPAGVYPMLTIVCYGGVLNNVEKAVVRAFYDLEILCEIICLSRIQPLNMWPIGLSAKKTGRLLIVEEGPTVAALGSEIASQLIEQGISIKSLVRGGNNSIIPCSLEAEQSLMPTDENIYHLIEQCLHER